MMRLAAVIGLTFALACADGSGTSVSFAIPAATRQALTGFEAGGRAVVGLEVVCDDGRTGTYERELATRVESVGFFVPACGPATLNLTITATYEAQDPVLAFEATSAAILESGVNSDVTFTGIAYGELVLDPLGQPIFRCTYEQSGGGAPATDVLMDGSVIAIRVPAGDYDVYCFDTSSSFPNYQPTRVGAGQRAGPDLTLRPDAPPPQPRLPVIESLSFFSITETSVLVAWSYTKYNLEPISFTLDIALDAAFTEVAASTVVTDTSNHPVSDLVPGTRYYVRLVGSDSAGTSNTITGDFQTLAPPGSPYLATITINGQPLTGFSPTSFGYSYTAGAGDATLTFTATTIDSTSYVRVETDNESQGATTSVQAIPVGTTQIDIFVRNADNSASQSYAIAVFRP